MGVCRLYLSYVAVSIRAQMQYRASFIMQSVGHLMITGFEFLAMVVLFLRFETLVGWTLHEVAVLYGITHTAFAIAEGGARGFDTFPSIVKSGDFDRLLVRPRSTAFQVAARGVQLMRVGRLIQGLTVLVWALAAGGFHVGAGQVLLVIAAIMGGACFFSGLFVLQGTLSFWTIEALEIVNTVTYGGVETTQFPLSIYRPWFRRFFTFVVPLACVSFFPGLAILGVESRTLAPEWFLWIAPLGGVIFLWFTLRLWQIGVRRYTSTGS